MYTTKRISKKDGVLALLLWFAGTFMLVPFREWTDFHAGNGAKFFCLATGLFVVVKACQAFYGKA